MQLVLLKLIHFILKVKHKFNGKHGDNNFNYCPATVTMGKVHFPRCMKSHEICPSGFSENLSVTVNNGLL